MISTDAAAERRSAVAVPLTGAQLRVVAAAVELFGTYGVSGTSLQMIADELGVTKAAVYHQFKAKEEIVSAVAMTELLVLEEAINRAEAEPDRAWARELVISKVVDILVARRQRATLMQSDPVMVRLLEQYEPFRQLRERLYQLLIGEGGVESRVQAAMLTTAFMAAVSHPLAAELDDDELRAQLLSFAHRLLRAPDQPAEG